MDPPSEVIDDVLFRCVSSAPSRHLTSVEEFMFLLEQAWWFYEDHVRVQKPYLKKFNKFDAFAAAVFEKCQQILQDHTVNLDDMMRRFNAYKRKIPVYGAIILDESLERVLLVRGYRSASGWGFPKGKINQGETPAKCAIREVHEETGLAEELLEQLLDENDFIEVYADSKLNKLFIIAGVDPETTVFAPKTKQEIGAYGWHYIKDLPSTIEEANQVYLSQHGVKHRFYMVQPFIKDLRRWIKNRKRSMASNYQSKAESFTGSFAHIAGSFGLGQFIPDPSAAPPAPAPMPTTAIATSTPQAPRQLQQQQSSRSPALAALFPQLQQQSPALAAGRAFPDQPFYTAATAIAQQQAPIATLCKPAAAGFRTESKTLKNFKFDQEAILRCLADPPAAGQVAMMDSAIMHASQWQALLGVGQQA